MRPSKFTEAQIQQALKQVRTGVPAVEMCRSLGITETTFYRWRKKFEVTRDEESTALSALREENEKLRHIVADLLLEARRGSDARRGG